MGVTISAYVKDEFYWRIKDHLHKINHGRPRRSWVTTGDIVADAVEKYLDEKDPLPKETANAA